MQHVGSRDCPRLRIGIGRQEGLRQITGHVLGKFGAEEQALLKQVLDRAAEPIGMLVGRRNTKGDEPI